MRELPRLIHDGADDFELSLLRSTDLDVGSNQALERTLAAVGLTGAIASSSTSASAASLSPQAAAAGAGTGAGALAGGQSVSAGLTAKWLGVGLVGMAALGGIWFSSQSAPEPAAAVTPTVFAAPRAEAEQASAAKTQNAATQPVETVSVQDLGNIRGADDASNKAEATNDFGRAAKKKGAAASLSDEIKAVSEIRQNLSNPSAALQAIGRYQQRFPRGQLQQEVTVLKIMALQRSGQGAQAKSLGERFLAAHPTSAHAKRVRSVLGL